MVEAILSSERLREPPGQRDLVQSSVLPPTELTTAAFVFVLDVSGQLLLTRVADVNRGWDIPGGHREPGEDTYITAMRELAEETGYSLPQHDLSVLGWSRNRFEGTEPPDFPYPWPLNYMVSFWARLPKHRPPVMPPPGSECVDAAWFTPRDVVRLCADHGWLPLYIAIVSGMHGERSEAEYR